MFNVNTGALESFYGVDLLLQGPTLPKNAAGPENMSDPTHSAPVTCCVQAAASSYRSNSESESERPNAAGSKSTAICHSRQKDASEENKQNFSNPKQTEKHMNVFIICSPSH